MRRAVLHLADYAAPYGGGFLASLLALRPVVAEMGMRLVLAFPEDARGRPWLEAVREAGVEHRFLPLGPGRARTFLAVAALLRRERPLLVHTHFSHFDVAARAAAMLPLASPAPAVVWHVHSAFPIARTLQRRLRDLVRMRWLGAGAWAVVVSDALGVSFEERGFPADRIRVVPNGIDLDRLRSHASREVVRAELGLPPAACGVLVLGWEPRTKGVDVVLDAARQLRGRSDLHWVLVGEERLRACVAEAGGAWEQLHVVAPRADVASYYAACDLFVSASRWEGFAYALGEAAALGLRCIASDIPGVAWAHRVPGVVFFPSGDAAALAGSVERAAIAPHRRQQEGAAYVARNMSVDAWARAMGELYQRALAAPARRGAPARVPGVP